MAVSKIGGMLPGSSTPSTGSRPLQELVQLRSLHPSTASSDATPTATPTSIMQPYAMVQSPSMFSEIDDLPLDGLQEGCEENLSSSQPHICHNAAIIPPQAETVVPFPIPARKRSRTTRTAKVSLPNPSETGTVTSTSTSTGDSGSSCRRSSRSSVSSGNFLQRNSFLGTFPSRLSTQSAAFGTWSQ